LRLAPFDDLERQRIGALGEIDRNAGHGGSGAVLDREGEIGLSASRTERCPFQPGFLGASHRAF